MKEFITKWKHFDNHINNSMDTSIKYSMCFLIIKYIVGGNLKINHQELKAYVYERFKKRDSRPMRSFEQETYMLEKINQALESKFFLTLLLFNNEKFNIAGNYIFEIIYIENDMN